MRTDPPLSENTYVLDAESSTELARLMKQDCLLTEGMGVCSQSDMKLIRLKRTPKEL